MTVKELLTILEFYPVNAEIFVETQDGSLTQVAEFNESTDGKIPSVVMTVKKPEELT